MRLDCRPGRCRQHGITDATFYKSREGGMEVSDARRLKALEDENQGIGFAVSGPKRTHPLTIYMFANIKTQER